MVHVEAAGVCRLGHPSLEWLVNERTLGSFLVFDLLVGSVTPDYGLYPWLLSNGASPRDLEEIERKRILLDVMGLNFYPQWSTREIAVDSRGQLVYRKVEKDGAGFATMIDDYYRRYGVPIMVTETSARGAPDVRARWLAASVAAIRRLRSQGVPVLGYTWFPLFTMIDWRYRFGRGPLEQYRLELGLYTLDESAGGGRWRATPLVEQLRGDIDNPDEAIGPLPGVRSQESGVRSRD
jgi:hypothetical protein